MSQSVISETVCGQAKIIGTCTSWIRRYWHNPSSRQCEQFDYSGCGGNDNNFATMLECQDFCRDTTGWGNVFLLLQSEKTQLFESFCNVCSSVTV